MNYQQTENSQEKEIHLRDYWRVIVKYRWTIITIFSVIVVSIALITLNMRPIYQASAKIQIDTASPHVLSIDEVAPLGSKDTNYYRTQHEILQSRSLAKKVINSLNLGHHPEFQRQKAGGHSILTQLAGPLKNYLTFFMPSRTHSVTIPHPDKVDVERESELIDGFLSRLKITPAKDSNIFNISFMAGDPSLVAEVADTLAEQYIHGNLQLKYEASKEATNWLNQHVDELKKQLQQSEEALQSYKERTEIISLEEKQNIIDQRLHDLSSAVTDVKTERIRIETLYSQIKKFSGNRELIGTLPLILNNFFIQKLKGDYIALLAEYNRGSKKYGPKHPHLIKINSQLKTIQKRIKSEIEQIINGTKTEYEIAMAQENALLDALNEQKIEALELSKKAIQYNVLKRDAESNKQMFEIVLNRLKETDLTSRLRSSNVRIVDRAEIPDRPIRPRKTLYLLLASLTGLFIGTMMAFFLEYLDNTIKTPDDLKHYLNLPFLGHVPHINASEIKKAKDGSTPELITLYKPTSQISESYKVIRTSILFSHPENSPKSILITSGCPHEGKTITAANLAITMARSGARVIIIDCDMREPRLHQIFRCHNEKGISNHLMGQCPLEEVLQEGPIPNMNIMTSGQCPPHTSELLISSCLNKVLEALKAWYDLIIIDSPPLVPITDSVIISRFVDSVVLVLHGGVTDREIVMRARDLLHSAKAHILGAIINNIDLSRYNSYYYYYHYYGDSKKSNQIRKRRRESITSGTN